MSHDSSVPLPVHLSTFPLGQASTPPYSAILPLASGLSQARLPQLLFCCFASGSAKRRMDSSSGRSKVGVSSKMRIAHRARMRMPPYPPIPLACESTVDQPTAPAHLRWFHISVAISTQTVGQLHVTRKERHNQSHVPQFNRTEPVLIIFKHMLQPLPTEAERGKTALLPQLAEAATERAASELLHVRHAGVRLHCPEPRNVGWARANPLSER